MTKAIDRFIAALLALCASLTAADLAAQQYFRRDEDAGYLRGVDIDRLAILAGVKAISISMGSPTSRTLSRYPITSGPWCPAMEATKCPNLLRQQF